MRKSVYSGCALVLFTLSSACGDPSNASDEATGGSGGKGGSSGGQSSNAGGSSAQSGGTSGSGGATSGGTAGATGGGSSGGSAGTSADAGSGNGGTATKGPPLPCDEVSSSTEWENISPPDQSDTTALIEDPFVDGTVWLGTTNGGLFKSTNCGAEFTHVSTGTLADEMNAPGQGMLSMAIDPVDQGTMYVFKYGGHGVLKSTNYGVDFFQTIADGSEVANAIPSKYIDAISMDPNDHLHLLTSNHVGCNAPYDPTCMSETTDGGETWRVFKAPPYTGWEEGAGPFIIDASTWVYAGLHLFLTTNAGEDWENLDPDPAEWWGFNNGEVETHSIPHAPDGNYYLPAGQGIIRSTDGGLSWNLIPNSGGRKVGFIIGDSHFYASDRWTPSVHSAPLDDPMTWTKMPEPGIPEGQGCPYLDYDPAHHILYASCYGSGAWRIKAE